MAPANARRQHSLQQMAQLVQIAMEHGKYLKILQNFGVGIY